VQRKARITGTLYALILHKPIDGWILSLLLLTLDISLKEDTFELSSPIRHATELISLISSDVQPKPVLFLYTDGGPDQQLTFIAVKLSLISVFLQLDLDYLCVARTAPYHSWRNPEERVMSVINLGLDWHGTKWMITVNNYWKELGI